MTDAVGLLTLISLHVCIYLQSVASEIITEEREQERI